MYAYYEKEGQGVCSVTDADHVSGKFAGRLEKTDDKDWFPVFYTRGSTRAAGVDVRAAGDGQVRPALRDALQPRGRAR